MCGMDLRDRAGRGAHLAAGDEVTVILVKHEAENVEYAATVLHDDGNHLVVQASWPWAHSAELGFVTFGPGDVFTEHYWRDRWFSVKEVRSTGGTRKGWYCDVARPVRLGPGEVLSEDLYLDLWASADLATILRLDEDELAASDLEQTDPTAAATALRALDELERWARTGFEGL
jgi:hypothetical protein